MYIVLLCVYSTIIIAVSCLCSFIYLLFPISIAEKFKTIRRQHRQGCAKLT